MKHVFRHHFMYGTFCHTLTFKIKRRKHGGNYFQAKNYQNRCLPFEEWDNKVKGNERWWQQHQQHHEHEQKSKCIWFNKLSYLMLQQESIGNVKRENLQWTHRLLVFLHHSLHLFLFHFIFSNRYLVLVLMKIRHNSFNLLAISCRATAHSWFMSQSFDLVITTHY